jgi:hypothetical protein
MTRAKKQERQLQKGVEVEHPTLVHNKGKGPTSEYRLPSEDNPYSVLRNIEQDRVYYDTEHD